MIASLPGREEFGLHLLHFEGPAGLTCDVVSPEVKEWEYGRS